MEQRSQTLLCWHAKRAGIEVVTKTVAGLKHRDISITHVLYLVQNTSAPDQIDLPSGITIEQIEMPVTDPTAHAAIYQLLHERVLPRLKHLEGELHINISPGTPAMHSIWLMLHAGGALPQNTRLWSSQYSQETKRTRIDPVNFSITTYLSEIRHYEHLDPGLAVYEPEARSPARRAALEKLKRYAQVCGAPLLILGERGTGKTRLVETYVATLKERNHVVTVACGGLDSTMAESLLFGHKKGAFTGAASDRKGLLAEAHKGVLFLDEVQDLPKEIQRKLVRVFQDRRHRYRPLGSDQERESDFELVCASNISAGELQQALDPDLFDRLSHLTLQVPPLRECSEDLLDDWRRVWLENRRRDDLPEEAPCTKELVDILSHHPLPGNLRDLQRLAILIMAWLTGSADASAIENALKDWKEDGLHTAKKPLHLGEGTRTERIHWFRKELAQWSKRQYGTWPKAAQQLSCDQKTLRNDASSTS